MVILVITDMVTFDKTFLVGLFITAIMATVTITYLFWMPSSLFEQCAKHKYRAIWYCETNQ